MLVDETVFPNNISIHGSPWSRTFGGTQAYMITQDELDQHWTKLRKCDILVTHTPPAGIFDNAHGMPLGCPGLLRQLPRVKPLVHIFGHIHEGHGGRKPHWWDTGKPKHTTYFANVAAMAKGYFPNGDPIFEFDIERRADGVVELTVDSGVYIR
jgi:hypothetical protein